MPPTTLQGRRIQEIPLDINGARILTRGIGEPPPYGVWWTTLEDLATQLADHLTASDWPITALELLPAQTTDTTHRTIDARRTP
jgi:hypothetical protein